MKVYDLTSDRAFRRARRIAESVGDAQAVRADGVWAIVCDTWQALIAAERLVESQRLPFSYLTSDQVESCDTCGVTESRTGAGTLPRGWAEQEDADGNLIGFLCPEHAGER